MSDEDQIIQTKAQRKEFVNNALLSIQASIVVLLRRQAATDAKLLGTSEEAEVKAIFAEVQQVEDQLFEAIPRYQPQQEDGVSESDVAN